MTVSSFPLLCPLMCQCGTRLPSLVTGRRSGGGGVVNQSLQFTVTLAVLTSLTAPSMWVVDVSCQKYCESVVYVFSRIVLLGRTMCTL